MSASAGEAEVCLINIGPRERRKRMTFGVVSFVFGLALFAGLEISGLGRWWRLVLFLPFAAAGAGFFQARDKT